MQVLNRGLGPRVFNVKAGEDRVAQVTLLPGQSADLDLVDPKDPVLTAWVDAEEVMLGADAERRMRRDQKGTEDRAERMASLRKELAELEAEQAREVAPPDAALRSPPAQFGGDGGPQQMPTPGGRAGDPTPKQGDGTPAQKAEAARREQAEPTGAASQPAPKAEQKPAAKAKG